MMNLNIQKFGEITGYNQHGINQVITAVKVSYENFYRSFDNDNKNTVESMSHLWESGDAQQFFRNDFKVKMENLINGAGGLNNCVRTIVDAIANAGNEWSKEIGNSDTFSSDFSPLTLDVSVDAIQDHFPDSSSGADIQATKSEAESQLNTIKQHVDECCNNLKDAVETAAFLDDHNLQHEDLKAAIDKVNDSFVEAITAINNSINNAVEQETNVMRTHAENTRFEVR